jgi:diphthamide synthase (EF-2-diphthine--ammonia ligase)
LANIHLADCLRAAQKVAEDRGLEAMEPLWHRGQEHILRSFIDDGFEAVVVSTQASLLDETWVGRAIDQALLDDMRRRPDVDACGEKGIPYFGGGRPAV